MSWLENFTRLTDNSHSLLSREASSDLCHLWFHYSLPARLWQAISLTNTGLLSIKPFRIHMNKISINMLDVLRKTRNYNYFFIRICFLNPSHKWIWIFNRNLESLSISYHNDVINWIIRYTHSWCYGHRWSDRQGLQLFCDNLHYFNKVLLLWTQI